MWEGAGEPTGSDLTPENPNLRTCPHCGAPIIDQTIGIGWGSETKEVCTNNKCPAKQSGPKAKEKKANWCR